ncbi:unnamed protein product [Discula destructiva]
MVAMVVVVLVLLVLLSPVPHIFVSMQSYVHKDRHDRSRPPPPAQEWCALTSSSQSPAAHSQPVHPQAPPPRKRASPHRHCVQPIRRQDYRPHRLGTHARPRPAVPACRRAADHNRAAGAAAAGAGAGAARTEAGRTVPVVVAEEDIARLDRSHAAHVVAVVGGVRLRAAGGVRIVGVEGRRSLAGRGAGIRLAGMASGMVARCNRLVVGEGRASASARAQGSGRGDRSSGSVSALCPEHLWRP